MATRHIGGIPVRNLWWLFLYAHDLLEHRGLFDADVEQSPDIAHLVARLLVGAVEQRLRRPLSRSMHARTAALPRVRGRIDVLRTESGRLLDRARIACRFDEPSVDTVRNRLFRAALAHLAARRLEDAAHLAERCRSLVLALDARGVAPAVPTRRERSLDRIARHEAEDRLPKALAELALDLALPTEEHGPHALLAPERYEELVRKLFERAVGNFLRHELEPSGWTVAQGRKIRWPVQSATTGLAVILPGMEIDILLDHPRDGRRMIIDTKFTRIFTSSQYRDTLLRSGHLYQLYAYLRSQERTEDPASLHAEGLLLYPAIEVEVDEAACIQDHRFRLLTVPLGGDIAGIESCLRAIAAPEACSEGWR